MKYKVFFICVMACFFLCTVPEIMGMREHTTIYSPSYFQSLPTSWLLPGGIHTPYIVLRDCIVERSVTSYTQWVEYNLYMSDVSLWETTEFIKRGDVDSARKTGMKSQHHITQAVTGYKYAGLSRESISSELDRAFDGILERQEFILTNCKEDNASGESSNLYEQMSSFLLSNKQGLSDLRKTMGRTI